MDRSQSGSTMLTTWNKRLDALRRGNGATTTLSQDIWCKDSNWLQLLAQDQVLARDTFTQIQLLLHPELHTTLDWRERWQNVITTFLQSGRLTPDEAADLQELLKTDWDRAAENLSKLQAQVVSLCDDPYAGANVSNEEAVRITQIEIAVAKDIRNRDGIMKIMAEHADKLVKDGPRLELLRALHVQRRQIIWEQEVGQSIRT